MEILQIRNLSFKYPVSEQKALDGIDISVRKGEFLLLCGASGCGKTTLLRLLKREIAPYGQKSGEILFGGTSVDELGEAESASQIGFVGQDPEEQIVTDKVWHELAFGLENLGVEKESIRRRVGEMASFFGIHNWYRKNTYELSGGQKQLLNLASVMVMQPKILLLDEPTSQLDPIAAADFIAALQKINRELGVTVILVEHRLEEVFPAVDRVVAMDGGRILYDGCARNAGQKLRGTPLEAGLPCAVRIFNSLEIKDECPLTVREGREFLEKHFSHASGRSVEPKESSAKETVLEAKDIWFRYEKNLPDVLTGLDFKACKGEIISVLGGNGSGKTTMLNILAGLDKPYKGKVRLGGKKLSDFKGGSLYRNNIAVLPQNPKTLFIKDKIEDDFRLVLAENTAADSLMKEMSKRFGVEHLLQKHPYDLSGGELQKCAICKLMLSQPQVLLLDEPTKGFDAAYKLHLAQILRELQSEGKTVISVTHDVEFAAAVSDRCALFFDGGIISEDTPNAFFSENNFYTTAASRISRDMFKNAVLCEEVAACCKGDAR